MLTFAIYSKFAFRYHLIIIIILITACMPLYSQPVLELHEEKDSYDPSRYMQILEDPTQSLTIEQVSAAAFADKFHADTTRHHNYGYTSSGYWIRLRVKSPENHHTLWVLTVQNSSLETANLYSPRTLADGNRKFGIKKAGANAPFSARELKYRIPAFSLSMPPGTEKTYYLYVASRAPVHFPMQVMTAKQFGAEDHLSQLLQGIYFGLMLVMIFYNLFLFISIRDMSYLYYLFYVASFGLVQASMNGMGHEYLWQEPSWWTHHSIPIFISTSIGLGSLFCISFLNLKKTAIVFYRIFIGLTIASGLLLLSNFVISLYVTLLIGTVLGMVFAILVLVVSVYCLIRRYRPALFLLIAWGMLLVGIILFALHSLGLLPTNFITTYSMQIGSALDVLLLSLALADRINVLQQERMSIEQEKAQAEHSKKVKEEFLASVSHEIRTPMNAIVGFARLLEDAPLPNKEKEYVKHICLSADNLLLIINDILDISKIDAGKVRFEKVEIQFAERVKLLSETISFQIKEKNLAFNCHIDEQIPGVFLGDPVRLNQILLNLLSNAVKFTHQGEVSFRAQLQEETAEKLTIAFQVRDTGIGIPTDKLSSIFDSYSQASKQTTRLYGGTGLGLTIAKQLIELQGGSIRVDSHEGTGSVFTVTMPFYKISKSQEKAKPALVNTPLLAQLPLSILLVDDNSLNQMVTVHTLQHWKPEIKVEVASSGMECLDKLNKQPYDLVFLDIQMPEMNGFDTATYIRTALPAPINAIPIVALSASDSMQDRKKAIEAGMNDYMVKPFQINDLERVIENTGFKSFDTNTNFQNKFDLSHVEKACLGDQEFIIQIMNLFLETSPLTLEQMQEAAKAQKWRDLASLAHKNLSIFTTLGLFGLRDQFKQLELACKAETEVDSENINGLLTRLKNDFYQVLTEILRERDMLLSQTVINQINH